MVPPIFIGILASLVIYLNFLNKPPKDSFESVEAQTIKFGDMISFGLAKANNHNDVLEIMNWAKKDKRLRFVQVIDQNGRLVIEYNPDKLSSMDYQGGTLEIDKMLFYTADNIYGEASGRLTIGYSIERIYNQLKLACRPIRAIHVGSRFENSRCADDRGCPARACRMPAPAFPARNVHRTGRTCRACRAFRR